MDWKEFVKDEILLSEKAQDYFSEAQTQKRRRKNFFPIHNNTPLYNTIH
jgi:hypothetical protein